jgi:iron complex transport system substrate-binding protein
MRRRLFLWLWCWLVLGMVSAQAATIPDMLGRPVAVPEEPLRLVSLAPSLTEIVFALGRGDWLVGVTDFCDYPPAARSKPKVGGPMTPNLERIVQVRATLVLATAEGNPRDTVAHLTRLGIPVFGVKAETYADILEAVRSLGHVLRTEEAAKALVGDIQARVAAIRRAVRGRPQPRVLYLVWTDPPIAAGPASFIHDLIGMAGGENVVQERRMPYPRLSWEEVVGREPEVILVATHRDAGDRPINREPWNTWRNIPAVQSGRLVAVPGDTIHRPGPRVIEGLERLARAIHPEAFPPREVR